MSSPSQVEHILSPSNEDTIMTGTPPQTGRANKSTKSLPSNVDLSVFDIQNIFRRRWFLSRAHLLTNVISAQKDEDGNISWVEFTPQYHSHLVKCAVALVPHPVLKVKKVMFVYILELLNEGGHEAFFNLKSGGRKANNAQKEKRRLARKRSRASKREREREAAKVAKLPTRQRQCMTCGRKFESRKTAKKHKCPKAKVERVRLEAAGGEASQARPPAKLNKPPATITPHAPTTTRMAPVKARPPPNSNVTPSVTGGLKIWDEGDPEVPGTRGFRLQRIVGGSDRMTTPARENADTLVATGNWQLGWS
jgi:predicted RNA-binding Zn-ribbon protein involved in translation (DUF1610 family)